LVDEEEKEGGNRKIDGKREGEGALFIEKRGAAQQRGVRQAGTYVCMYARV